MKHNHNRWSFPLDKMIPKFYRKNKKSRDYRLIKGRSKTEKNMHNAKQRDWNKKVIKEELNNISPYSVTDQHSNLRN